MTFRAVLSDEAAKTLARADAKLRVRLINRIKALAGDPFDPRLSAPLAGRPGLRKSRVGDWRLLFTVDRTNGALNVAAIDTRGQVYKR